MKNRFEYIVGPISFSEHYSEKYKKHIYIFGDEHVLKSTCPNRTSMSDAILDTLKNNPGKIIDLFLEAPYFKTEIDWYISDSYIHLPAIRKCLNVIKKHCPYPNLRAHYSDIRGYNDIRYLHHIIRNEIRNFFDENYNTSIDCKDFKKYVKHFSSFMSNNKNYYVKILKGKISKENFVDDIFKNKLMAKQFATCPQEVKNVMRKIFTEEYERIIKNTPNFNILNNDIIEFGDICKGNYEKNPIIIINKVRDTLLSSMIALGSIFMDAYLMGRLFRTFIEPVNSKYNKYAQYNINPGEIHYAIIYVGDEHAQMYRKILNALNFTSSGVRTNNNQCLYVGDVEPFFSQHTFTSVPGILGKAKHYGASPSTNPKSRKSAKRSRKKAKSKKSVKKSRRKPRVTKSGKRSRKKAKSKKSVKKSRKKAKSKKSVKKSRRKPRVRKSVKRPRKKAKSKKSAKKARKGSRK